MLLFFMISYIFSNSSTGVTKTVAPPTTTWDILPGAAVAAMGADTLSVLLEQCSRMMEMADLTFSSSVPMSTAVLPLRRKPPELLILVK